MMKFFFFNDSTELLLSVSLYPFLPSNCKIVSFLAKSLNMSSNDYIQESTLNSTWELSYRVTHNEWDWKDDPKQ